MDDLILRYPLHCLDGRLLLPAGTRLDEATMRALIRENKSTCRRVPLLSYRTIRADLLQYLSVEPYRTIFSEKETTSAILEVMAEVALPLPVLEGVSRFKTYDLHSYRHLLVIFALSMLIARDLIPGYLEQVSDKILHAGPTHDFGKIAVPREVLLKETPLTRLEYDLLRHHTVAGYVLLNYYMKEAGMAGLISLQHHERQDGSGYPRGIDNIGLMVEIVTVSDIYDALIAQRPYRPTPYDNRTALDELTALAAEGKIGSDPVQVLIAHNRRNKPDWRTFIISSQRRGKGPSDNMYGKIAADDLSSGEESSA